MELPEDMHDFLYDLNDAVLKADAKAARKEQTGWGVVAAVLCGLLERSRALIEAQAGQLDAARTTDDDLAVFLDEQGHLRADVFDKAVPADEFVARIRAALAARAIAKGEG